MTPQPTLQMHPTTFLSVLEILSKLAIEIKCSGGHSSGQSD